MITRLVGAFALVFGLVGIAGCVMDDSSNELTEIEQEVALPPPTNLMGTVVSSTQINLSWDASPGATLYIIYRGFTPGSETAYTTSSAASPTFQAKQLTPNTQYCWQVRNVNAQGQRSLPSNEVCLTTQMPAVVPAPTNVVATAISDSRITVTWDPVPGALKYFINRATGAGPFVRVSSVAAPETSFQDAGLMAATTYSYTIETVMPNNSASVPSSPPATATTFGLGLEGYWKFNSTSGQALDSSGHGRHGTLSGGAAFAMPAAPIDEKNNRSLLVTSAPSSTASVPNVAALNMTGSFSLVLWVNPQEAGDLSIAGMRAAGCGSIGWELGQSAAGLFFRNPISTVSFGTTLATNVWTHIGVTHAGGTMRLYINGSEVASGAYTTASFAALPLQFGHPGGCAGASALVDEAQIFSRQLDATEVQVLGERPPAPSTMTAAQRTSTSLDLSWASVANVQRYIVWRGLSAGATTLYTSVPPTPAFTADHLMADTTYFWRVQSVRNNLISEPSSEASAMTFPPPNPPSGLTATPISSTRINLSWTAEPRATKYFINESVNGGPFVRKTSSVGTAIQIANLQPNTMYSYTVQTFDTGLLTSSPSTPVGATTLP